MCATGASMASTAIVRTVHRARRRSRRRPTRRCGRRSGNHSTDLGETTMRYGTLGQSGGAVATAEQSGGGAAAAGVKEIPYDYVATFKLTGTRGTRAQDVINISTEGTFVAVSVGSSFLPAAKTLTPTAAPAPFKTTFDALFPGTTTGFGANDAFTALAESLLLRFGGIHFLYTIVDSGSGRELQNKSVHNIAG